jgi:hypothetical protein
MWRLGTGTMNRSGEPLQDGVPPAQRDVVLRWRSCTMCGGVSVPVRIRHEAGVGAFSLETSGGDCPHCETRRRRIEPPGGCTSLWYDTLLRDWVVRVPVVRFEMDAILPLGRF